MKKECESCLMPMQKPEHFSLKNPNSKYCVYCAPKGKPKKEAKKLADRDLKQAKAWRK